MKGLVLIKNLFAFLFVLPRECKVVNLKSEKREEVRGRFLPLEMSAGETCWFAIR